MRRSELAVRFDYPVVFTERVLDPASRVLVEVIARHEPGRRHRVLAVIERAVAQAHPATSGEIEAWARRNERSIELAGPVVVLPGGEACKASMDRVLDVAALLEARHIDRQAVVLVIGGGAFLDMVGFAAAITHRGVRLVRVPTTVLAQADSAVGVKNGINAYGKKNFLGCFAPPFAVVNDRAFLATLSDRDRRTGMSEAVKVALIRDARLFEWIAAHTAALHEGVGPELDELIERSAELHAGHIARGGDPFENGAARPLDFGHWAAHKLEALSAFEIRHGEGVAVGVALDAWYSAEVGLMPRAHAETIASTLEALGMPLWHAPLDARTAGGRPAILDGLEEFREHLGGELTVTMLADIGRGVEVHAIDHATMIRGLDWLRARAGR